MVVCTWPTPVLLLAVAVSVGGVQVHVGCTRADCAGETVAARLAEFNHQLTEVLRRNFSAINRGWPTFAASAVPKVHYKDEGFSQQILQVPGAVGLFLEHVDGPLASNVLDRSLYLPTFSADLCALVNEQAVPHGYEKTLRGHCFSALSSLAQPAANISAVPLMDLSLPLQRFDLNPTVGVRLLTSIHIIPHALVDTAGVVRTSGLQMIPSGCFNPSHTLAVPPQGTSVPRYRAIFSVCHVWGQTFYHKTVESIPRLLPFLPFLQEHPHVMIHGCDAGSYTRALLQELKLGAERLVTGIVKTDLLLMPAGSPCGGANTLAIQLFAQALRPVPPTLRTIVLVQRTGSRRLASFEAVRVGLLQLAHEHRLSLHIFADNPPPAHAETKAIFGAATLVVAPHGAGLANLVYVQRRAFVVEALCEQPHTNLCYASLSAQLGLRYHGVVSPESGCEGVIHTPADVLLVAAASFLRLAAAEDP